MDGRTRLYVVPPCAFLALDPSRGRRERAGWSKAAPSDPYTTGIALYVLAKVGANDHKEVRDKAIVFLLASQQSDGSWKTEPKYISGATTPEQLATRAEIYHYWGTSWAVLGLLSTLAE